MSARPYCDHCLDPMFLQDGEFACDCAAVRAMACEEIDDAETYDAFDDAAE